MMYTGAEFGWLVLDGIPLREDISLVATRQGDDWREVIVGGLPTGDCFPVGTGGHLCNPAGIIQTSKRRRTTPEYEMVVVATTAHHQRLSNAQHEQLCVLRAGFVGFRQNYKRWRKPLISNSSPVYCRTMRLVQSLSILSAPMPQRNLTLCWQHSESYNNKGKMTPHGVRRDEHAQTPYSLLGSTNGTE